MGTASCFLTTTCTWVFCFNSSNCLNAGDDGGGDDDYGDVDDDGVVGDDDDDDGDDDVEPSRRGWQRLE